MGLCIFCCKKYWANTTTVDSAYQFIVNCQEIFLGIASCYRTAITNHNKCLCLCTTVAYKSAHERWYTKQGCVVVWLKMHIANFHLTDPNINTLLAVPKQITKQDRNKQQSATWHCTCWNVIW